MLVPYTSQLSPLQGPALFGNMEASCATMNKTPIFCKPTQQLPVNLQDHLNVS